MVKGKTIMALTTTQVFTKCSRFVDLALCMGFPSFLDLPCHYFLWEFLLLIAAGMSPTTRLSKSRIHPFPKVLCYSSAKPPSL
jgi:hypothetical protein